MVDEYQDTSDTQEKFISLISSNNVYMVGDIKQSIYRFRNANPYIFKNKYDTYRDTDVGEKIDLLKNFIYILFFERSSILSLYILHWTSVIALAISFRLIGLSIFSDK